MLFQHFPNAASSANSFQRNVSRCCSRKRHFLSQTTKRTKLIGNKKTWTCWNLSNIRKHFKPSKYFTLQSFIFKANCNFVGYHHSDLHSLSVDSSFSFAISNKIFKKNCRKSISSFSLSVSPVFPRFLFLFYSFFESGGDCWILMFDVQQFVFFWNLTNSIFSTLLEGVRDETFQLWFLENCRSSRNKSCDPVPQNSGVRTVGAGDESIPPKGFDLSKNLDKILKGLPRRFEIFNNTNKIIFLCQWVYPIKVYYIIEATSNIYIINKLFLVTSWFKMWAFISNKLTWAVEH